jgi:hypothetical protein
MGELPTDWLEKLFQSMRYFYQERWENPLKDKQYRDLFKTVWNNTLRDLSYEQIRNGLKKCKYESQFKYSKPPNNMKFYHWCLNLEYKKPELKKNFSYVPRRT